MVKTITSINVDAWYLEQARIRGMNVSAVAEEAIRRLIDAKIGDTELRIFKEHFLPLGFHLDTVIKFPESCDLDGLAGKDVRIVAICKLLADKRRDDVGIFRIILDDVKRAIPDFNKEKGEKIYGTD